MSKFTLDDIMRKVQAMLDRADHPNTPEGEADVCRAKAEKWMAEYRIEESELIASGALNDEIHRPGSKHIVVCPAESPYMNDYWRIMVTVAAHVGARVHYKFAFKEGTLEYMLYGVIVGYEADIRFAEALFTNARLLFGDRMEPKVNPNLSDEDNVYRLRSSGMERIKIAKVMGYGDTGSATAKVTRLYKRACEARGEDPILTGRGMSVVVFREQYAKGFTTEFQSRCYRAHQAADSTGGALVLADRKDRINDAFYELFPDLRPDKVAVRDNKPAKRRKAWTKADERRWEQANSAAGQAGRSSGARAASEVAIDGVKPAKRINE
jgi:hypothetical protein